MEVLFGAGINGLEMNTGSRIYVPAPAVRLMKRELIGRMLVLDGGYKSLGN